MNLLLLEYYFPVLSLNSAACPGIIDDQVGFVVVLFFKFQAVTFALFSFLWSLSLGFDSCNRSATILVKPMMDGFNSSLFPGP